MGSHRITMPERVLRKAEGFVKRSGLYPDPQTLISEASVRYLMNIRGRAYIGSDNAVRSYRMESWGSDIGIEITMPDGVHSELSALSNLLEANLFAVAVLEHMDRLYRIS